MKLAIDLHVIAHYDRLGVGCKDEHIAVTIHKGVTQHEAYRQASLLALVEHLPVDFEFNGAMHRVNFGPGFERVDIARSSKP